MKRSLILALSLLMLAVLPAQSCKPQPSPVPPTPPVVTDAGPAPASGGATGAGGAPSSGGAHGSGGAAPSDPYEAACWNLAHVGCPGIGTACASRLRLADEHHTTAKPISFPCLTGAATRKAADACGYGCE